MNKSDTKKLLKGQQSIKHKIESELIHGGHMPAIDTCSLTFTSSLILGFIPTLDLLIAAYLFSFASYNLNRKKDVDHDSISWPDRSKYIKNRIEYLDWIILISYSVSLLIAYNRNLQFFLLLFSPLILSYIYNIGSKRLIPIIGKSRLKEKLLLKNLLISLAWGLIAFLTLAYFDGIITATVIMVYISIFFRVFINSVFSDIKDIKSDYSQGITTIPIILGINKTRNLLIVLNTFSGVFVFISIIIGLLPPLMHFVNLITIYGYYYLLRSYGKNANMNYLSGFVAELEEIVAVPLVLIGVVVF